MGQVEGWLEAASNWTWTATWTRMAPSGALSLWARRF